MLDINDPVKDNECEITIVDDPNITDINIISEPARADGAYGVSETSGRMRSRLLTRPTSRRVKLILRRVLEPIGGLTHYGPAGGSLRTQVAVRQAQGVPGRGPGSHRRCRAPRQDTGGSIENGEPRTDPPASGMRQEADELVPDLYRRLPEVRITGSAAPGDYDLPFPGFVDDLLACVSC